MPENIRSLVVVGIEGSGVSAGSSPEATKRDSKLAWATWPLVLPRSAHYGDRRLRRNAFHIAPDVFVEHQIADDQHPCTAPSRLDESNNFGQVRDHRGHPSAATTCVMHVASSIHSHRICPQRI